jgi:RsiW-degrading membrane proteinase PrsW (M82 family)
MTFILIALAIMPSLAICYWIYLQDRYEKEPFSLLFKAFVVGCASTIPAMLLQIQFQDWQNEDSLLATAIFAFAIVGLTEELSKFVLMRFFIYPLDEFNEPMDGIVYAVMVSMGFATVENLMYVFGENNDGSISTAIGRAFTAVPAHAAFAVLMGSYMGLAKFVPERRNFYMFTGLGLAVFFHGLYDFFLLQKVYEGLGALAIGALVWGISAARYLIRFGQELSPFKPRFDDEPTADEDEDGEEIKGKYDYISDETQEAPPVETKENDEPIIKNDDLI